MLEILYNILMLPIVLLVSLFELIKEYWWAVLILLIVLWPAISNGVLENMEPAGMEQKEIAVVSDILDRDPTRESYNIGSCRSFKQNVDIMVLFLNDRESVWTAEEMTECLQEAVEPGLEFIEQEAARYGYALDLESAYYIDALGTPVSIPYSGTIVDGDTQEKNADLLYQSAVYLDLKDEKAMLEEDRSYSGEEQIAYLIVVNKDGRAYAHPSLEDDPEYAVLFNGISPEWERKNVVAHELLHLGGAEDLYAEDGKNTNRAILAEKFHPSDIMLDPHRWNFYGSIVGPFTAYCVGWLDTLPEEYNCPEWWS